MKVMWNYLWRERELFIFAIGLLLLFAALAQMELVGDYLRGAISFLMSLGLIFVSALIRRIP